MVAGDASSESTADTGLASGAATPSTGTRLSVQLRVLTAGAAHDQFYLPEISSCWDLDGSPCEPGTSAIATAVTRYTCFIIAPNVTGACSAKNQNSCPPYHVAIDGTRISRNDTVSSAPKPALSCVNSPIRFCACASAIVFRPNSLTPATSCTAHLALMAAAGATRTPTPIPKSCSNCCLAANGQRSASQRLQRMRG